MFIADAHCDTLYNLTAQGMQPEDCCVTPERMRKGGLYLQTFAMFTSLRRADPFEDGLRMREAYLSLPLQRLDARLPAEPPHKPSAILSIEGGEMLRGKLSSLNAFDNTTHPRLIALTWNYENEIATPACKNASDGLKSFGFELLAEMDRRGIAADVSHLNEGGFKDVINSAVLPPLASHSCCRWLCDVPRNLRREQVRALIERRGYIGVNFYSNFLVQGRAATIEDVAVHIDAICDMGGEDIVGFGSDFDGIDSWPEELASPEDFPRLLALLLKRGYTQEQISKIAGLNYWRYLHDVEALTPRADI